MANVDIKNTEKSSSTKKRPIKFDLSDGLQKEDFIALGSGLLKFIWKFLRIILYPVIWISRQIGRLRKFFGSHAAERTLTQEEIRFVSGIPIFLTLTGVIISGAIGFIALIFQLDAIKIRINQTFDLFSGIGNLLSFLYDLIVGFFGAIYDALIVIKNIVVNLADPTSSNVPLEIPFVILALIGFLVAIMTLIILELKALQLVVNRIKNSFNFFLAVPRKTYNKLDDSWTLLLVKVGRPVMGGEEKLLTFSNLYYRKIILRVVLFALLFSFLGLIFFIRSDVDILNLKLDNLIFLIALMFLAGFISGFPLAYSLVIILGNVGEDRYKKSKRKISSKSMKTTSAGTSGSGPTISSAMSKAQSTTESKSDKTPSQTVSSAKTQTPRKSAKERALERRKRREAAKKK